MMLWFNSHRRLRGQLSAYIDGELAERDAGALETHLQACESCGRELAELRLASAALRELPDIEAPRSFALTPAHVAGPAATTAPAAVRSVNSGLRLTGGVLAAALAVLLVLDTGGIVGGGGEGTQEPGVSFFAATGDEKAAGGADAFTEDAARSTESSSAQGYFATETPTPDGAAGNDNVPAPSPGATGSGAGGSAGVTGGPNSGSDLPSVTPLDSAGSQAPAPESPTATPQPLPATGGAGEVPEVSPRLPSQGEPAPALATATPVPGPDDLAAAPLVPNGTEEGELEALTTADSNVDSDGGPSALLVTEIVLAALLGVSLVGIAAATYTERRRR